MKKLLLLIVAVATVSLVSCKKDEAAKTDNGEAAQVEQAEEAPEVEEAASIEAPEPTGDVEADAKAMTEYLIKAGENVLDEESAEKYDLEIDQLEKTFKEYYGDKFSQLEAAAEKLLGTDKELKKKVDEINLKLDSF